MNVEELQDRLILRKMKEAKNFGGGGKGLDVERICNGAEQNVRAN